MRRLSPAELLHIWEYGQEQSLLPKSLMLLATACYPADYHLVSHWPIGTRDSLLIQLREQIFGAQLVNNAVCPVCSEILEWEMKTTDLLDQQQPVEWPEIPVYSAQITPFTIRYRLPHSADFMSNISEEPYQLVRNCILSAEKKGKAITTDAIPEDILQKLDATMEADDPLANLIFNLSCPGCQHKWKVVFDIINYLWKELDIWAKQLLQEVFILARAMGWTEADILAMSAKRRQFYLEMLRT